MVESNPDLARVIGASGGAVLDSYFATTLAIAAVVGTGFGVASALRFRSEETAGRAEPLLATGMSRTRLAARVPGRDRGRHAVPAGSDRTRGRADVRRRHR